jgi:hypothetical protein
MKVVLLNGPPRSGKSTSAKMLHQHIDDSTIIGFSYHLKRFTHGIYLGEKGWNQDPDVFDAVKNEPQLYLNGMSWRQVYIHYSEKVIKPLHGKRWFGNQWIKAAEDSKKSVILVPDSGFYDEAEAVVEFFGTENVLLIRLYREGYDFNNDSRSYINLDKLQVESYDVINTDLICLKEKLIDLTTVINAV